MRTNLKKVATIVIFAIIAVFATACAVTIEPPRHEHSFTSAWSCDEEYHWKVANCEHADEIFGKEKHLFNEGAVTEPTFEADGFVVYSCTVCSFAKTELGEPKKQHSFAASLSYDQKTHWYACLDEGYDVTKEPIPVVPSQHYFMGGIDTDRYSKTSMDRLYAAGETACNGVHGRNRLASNSLLESLVFAKRAAKHISEGYAPLTGESEITIDETKYENYREEYKAAVLEAIEKERNSRE